MSIEKGIHYIGVDDPNIRLFEGQYVTPNGMAYNSYIIADEKIAVMDTVEKSFTAKWLENLKNVLCGEKPDYIVIQHMEPDHSAGLADFLKEYPETTVVANTKAFDMMNRFFGEGLCENKLIINDGDTLSLGVRELKFVFAPMVHWPEVTVTYVAAEKALFSADAFGKFGTREADEDWTCEARRYYFGIVGKYGAQVQALLKKAAALDIEKIYPLHGPALTENIGCYLKLYDIWSAYGVESDGICLAYTSVYGNTEKAVNALCESLKKNGCEKIALNDLARCDMAEAVEDAFRYGTLVLATTTYNGDIFPFMRHFIDALTERGYRNRTIGLMENGSWAPVAARKMRAMLEGCKNITFAEPVVTVNSALDGTALRQIEELAAVLCEK